MQKKTILQRFLSLDTPDFEKAVQILCLVLVAAISHVPGVSPAIVNDVTVGGLAVAFFAQFASKDIAIYQAAANPLAGAMDVLQAIPDQISGLKDMVNANAATHTAQLDQLADSVQTIASAPLPLAPPLGPVTNDQDNAQPGAQGGPALKLTLRDQNQ